MTVDVWCPCRQLKLKALVPAGKVYHWLCCNCGTLVAVDMVKHEKTWTNLNQEMRG